MELNVSELIWSIINFLAFFGALVFVLWKPVLKLLADRQHEIENNLSRAEAAQREALALRDRYQQEIGTAQQQAAEIVNRAVAAAEKTRQEELARAQKEAEDLLNRARETIEREKDEAIAALRGEVADLALAVASRVLERNLTGEDQRRLADEFLQQVGPQQ